MFEYLFIGKSWLNVIFFLSRNQLCWCCNNLCLCLPLSAHTCPWNCLEMITCVRFLSFSLPKCRIVCTQMGQDQFVRRTHSTSDSPINENIRIGNASKVSYLLALFSTDTTFDQSKFGFDFWNCHFSTIRLLNQLIRFNTILFLSIRRFEVLEITKRFWDLPKVFLYFTLQRYFLGRHHSSEHPRFYLLFLAFFLFSFFSIPIKMGLAPNFSTSVCFSFVFDFGLSILFFILMRFNPIKDSSNQTKQNKHNKILLSW